MPTIADNAPTRVAVLVPCFNEAATVGTVVRDFAAALPGATIYVYDNNSTDGTADAAAAAGAVVRFQPLQGKGHVVRRMFADVEADVYVLVDGDATYHAPSAPAMVGLLVSRGLDMVNGRRIETAAAAYRNGHRIGNAAFSKAVSTLFGDRIDDLLSGYRVLSRRFVKSFPVASDGFQVETEMTVHALDMGLPVAEVETPYHERPTGSTSKLRTFRDGFRILGTLARLMIELKPTRTLGGLALVPGAAAAIEALLRGPSAPVPIACAILSATLLCTGLLMRNSRAARREAKHLAYLAIRPASAVENH